MTGPANGDFSAAEIVTEATRTGGLQLATLPGGGALAVYRHQGGHLEARRLHTVILGMTAASPALIADALARGIPVQVDLGADDVDLQVRLLDEARSLGLTRVVGRKTRSDVDQGSRMVRVRLKPAAAELLAKRNRLRLDIDVLAMPPNRPSESMRQKLILKK